MPQPNEDASADPARPVPRPTPRPRPAAPTPSEEELAAEEVAAAASGVIRAAAVGPKRDWVQALIAAVVTSILTALGVGAGGLNASNKLEASIAELKQSNVELKKQLEAVTVTILKTQETLAAIQATIVQDHAVDAAQRHEARIIAIEAAMTEYQRGAMERSMKIANLEKDVERLGREKTK